MSKGSRVLSSIGVMVISAALIAGCGKAKVDQAASAQPKDVVAKIDSKAITMADVNDKIAKLPAYYQKMVQDRKREFLDDMIIETVLYDEAKKRGLDKDAEVRSMLDEAERKIIVSKLIKDEVDVKASVTDKEIEDYYNTHKEEFSLPERTKASHILVKTEEEAKAVLDELSKGKAFEDLAKEKSLDSSSKKGGDIGYFTKGQLVPEFEEAAAKLEVGQISGIVKTQFGFHIIKVTDKKQPEAQEFKDVTTKIKNMLHMKQRQQAFDSLVEALKAKTKITINENAFGEAKAPVANEQGVPLEEVPQEAQPAQPQAPQPDNPDAGAQQAPEAGK